MKAFNTSVLILAFTLLTVPLSSDPLEGGSYELTGVITSGGGQTTGDGYVLTGASGQAATDTLTGGSYELAGGFIGVHVVPGDIAVTIERLADGSTKISWPADAVGFILEFTGWVGSGANWQPVSPAPLGNTLIVPFDQPLRCFRLRKP
jgi:hypothetical protein